jgi:hypothetical protein
MFLDNLTVSEKIAFYVLAKRFVKADTTVVTAEASVLSHFRREIGLPEDTYSAKMTLGQCLSAFRSRKSKVSVLLELIGIGHIDGQYSAPESRFIRMVAKAFGISLLEITALENWTLRLISLTREANTLMEGK